jgi:glycosyltransferase involved in cell wall biosynthesis
MTQPKVSIIVPIYNVENYLDRCMQSLINQTLRDIEIIMVDDESPDNCPVMCDVYAQQDNRIKVIHKKNGGLGFARNSGLEIASGKYVAFVDSDDYVDNEMFYKLYSEAIDRKSDIAYCSISNVKFNGAIKETNEFKKYLFFDKENEISNFLFNMIGAPPHIAHDRVYRMSVWHGIYSMDLIKNHNIRFQSERTMISEDLIFHICIIPHCNKISCLPFSGYYYCENGQSLSKSYRNDRLAKYIILHREMTRLLEKLYNKEQWINSVDRCIIGFARKNLIRILKAQIPFKEKLYQIKLILKDKYLNEIAKRYPSSMLPVKQKLFLLILKIL